MTARQQRTHCVIVGVEPTEEYAHESDGWTEEIFGPFTVEYAEEFANACEQAWAKERRRRRKNAFPYGTPYTKVRVLRNAGVNDAALNWVKEG